MNIIYKCMRLIKSLRSINLWKTIYLNFRIFPFKVAIKLPLKINHHVDFEGVRKNCIQFHAGSKIQRFMINIGDMPYPLCSKKGTYTYIRFSAEGKILLGENVTIRNGANIIVGRKGYIDLLKRHPLARAVRLDKMTLAALEATLNSYLDLARAEEEIPTLAMLNAKPERLKAKAEDLLQRILAKGEIRAEVVPEQDQVGGGSVPTQLMDTYAVAVTPTSCSLDGLEQRLRLGGETPIIGRIAKDRYLLDVRTLWEEDFDYIADRVAEEAK